jgi:hypothetical protein
MRNRRAHRVHPGLMRNERRRATAVQTAIILASLGFSGCAGDQPAARSVSITTPALAFDAATPAATTPGALEALPRAVGTVALKMTRHEVESQLGSLACHHNAEGFQVCRAADPKRGEPGLEVFLYRSQVISLAHEVPSPKEVWSYIETLTARYGKPVLNGMTERDRSGRLHEVYGWRDRHSLYSVRFVWQEAPTRNLNGAAITLWDREAYGAWEKDSARRSTELPPTPDFT